MALKDLTSRELKKIKGQLALFEFYGLSEDDIKRLPNILTEMNKIVEKQKVIEEKLDVLLKTISNQNDPDNYIKKEIVKNAKDYFKLPEVEVK